MIYCKPAPTVQYSIQQQPFSPSPPWVTEPDSPQTGVTLRFLPQEPRSGQQWKKRDHREKCK